ncbi:MAG: Alw26I/Eco31I/Esp3I family type II restriction endonuclease [Patescibacteria group bacterium]|nr:Alw26I/Eco31I/Esp3I family type II restriction endonuclease [Patescibacteria group bacterium]
MTIKYGRGKFNAHKNYIEYMSEIVAHDNYKGMPNAIDEKTGRINWQVSSGKTTSFYKHYLARTDWWTKKANELGLKGSGNSDNRFSIAARLLHPTGMRPCRLCGNLLHIGYMYLNYVLAKKWNKLSSQKGVFQKNQNIVEASLILVDLIGKDSFSKEIAELFPEKKDFLPREFNEVTLKDFFIKTSYRKSNYLSPGFMANPPDRLDGFHDYGICCRKKSDPGRSDENMRTYNHDRRAFKWWAEGDWIVADELYNNAGKGKCARCGREIEKVSPDHIGPLACGFKHIPIFAALCNSCNSAKNRRFNLQDIKELLKYEEETGSSVSSWQVKALWDFAKDTIKNDDEAKILGNLMRSLQDYYLRVLHRLYEKGMALPLSYLLSPDNALFSVTFVDLDPATLKYSSFSKIPLNTKGRNSLASRVIRIAFEELESYSSKEVSDRKLAKIYEEDWSNDISSIIETSSVYSKEDRVKEWDEVIRVDKKTSVEDKEEKIAQLFDDTYQESRSHYANLINILMLHFDKVGKKIAELLRN